MFQLGKTIVSEDLLEKDFVCNLTACKGACCVDGDAGAPLSFEETQILESIYPKVKPFLRKQGIAAIEAQGTWIKGIDGDLETPLIDNKDSKKRYRADVLLEDYVAKTQAIWNAWEGEMTLKSVIKRACKRHFKDVIVNIEIIDNENYDLDTVDLDYQIKEEIDSATTEEKLTEIYNKYLSKCKDEKIFISKLAAKKAEIKKQKK